MRPSLRLLPALVFAVLAGTPFACGGGSPAAPADAAVDGAVEGAVSLHHFDASSADDAADAADEYVQLAPHCARGQDAGGPPPGPGPGGATAPDAASQAEAGGETSDGGGDGDGDDASGPAAPAVLSLPQVLDWGGDVLHEPTLVSVTFPDDDLADSLDDYLASVGCTDYWHTVVSEYGVGDAVAGRPVRLTESAPPTTSDAQIRAWLVQKIDGLDPQFPRPQADTIYVVYYPDSTTIDLEGEKSCSQFGGYHEGAHLADGTPFAYAVIPRCQEELPQLTLAVSHEIVEACTDPHPDPPDQGDDRLPAYETTDVNHPGWELFAGAEVGDMCEFDDDAAYVPPGFPWVVQRIWSNRAAAAGQTPCLPADTPSYFYGVAEENDSVTLDALGYSTPSPTIHLAVGATATVALHLVGGGAGATGTMEVRAVDPNALYNMPTLLNLSLDRSTGAPGDVLHLTIQKPATTAGAGAEPFLIQTTMNGRQTLFWGMSSD